MTTLEGLSIWTVALLGFLPGIVLGSIAAYLALTRQRKTRQLQSELDDLKDRFTDYRDTVTQHFMQTSNLVQQMTDSYRAVYEHLASGAQHLCNVETGTNHLEQSNSAELENTETTAKIAAGNAFDYDDLAELSSIKDDIDHLMGESPSRPGADNQADNKDTTLLKH